MTTPIYDLTEWAAAQASPWVPHNAALRALEAVGRGSVVDRDLTAPPGTCVDGATYLIAASATGLWAGHDGEMAVAVGTDAANGWLFLPIAQEGALLWIDDENVRIEYDGSAWQPFSGGGGGATEASVAEIWAGTATGKYLSPDNLFGATAPQTLVDAATIAVDMAAGINFNVTIAGNRTLGNPTNAKPGQSGRIRVTQDATGGRTLAYGTDWKHVGSAPSIATAANAADVFAYFVNGVGDIELSHVGTLGS